MTWLSKESIYQAILLFVFSVLAMMLTTRLGGSPFGHHIKLVSVGVLYFWGTLGLLQSRNVLIPKAGLIIIILLPVTPIVLLHVVDFKGTVIAAFSTSFYFIGVATAWFVHRLSGKLKMVTGFAFLALSLWCATTGFDHLLFYANYRTSPYATLREEIDYFNIKTASGEVMSTADLKDEILVLDLWGTGCGLCFQKFPILEEVFTTYNDHPDIRVASLFVPSRFNDYSPREKELEMISQYSFTQYELADHEVAERLGVHSYPTVLLIKNGNQIIYRGNLKFATGVIEDLTR